MYIYDQACRVWRVAFNDGIADQVIIHSYNCSDLLVYYAFIVPESACLDPVPVFIREFDRSCEHKHVFHPAYHKPGTCQSRKRRLESQLMTQVLCCIEIADQEERLPLLPGEADKNLIFL